MLAIRPPSDPDLVVEMLQTSDSHLHSRASLKSILVSKHA